MTQRSRRESPSASIEFAATTVVSVVPLWLTSDANAIAANNLFRGKLPKIVKV
jgi:hypothetical protein